MWIKNKNVHSLCYLMSIQGANAVLPLFIFPYVLTVCGSKLYADIAIAEAFAFITQAFVIYGFDIDGISKIVKYRDAYDRNNLSKVCSNILYARVFIFLSSLLFILVANRFFSQEIFLSLLFWMLVPLSYILQSSYIYLGFENNLMIAIFTIVSRLACVVLIFLFVHSKVDFYKISFIVGMTYAMGGFCSFIYARVKFKLKFTKILISEIINILNESKEIFLGNASVILYRDSNIFILGLLSNNPVTIAAYSLANKFVKALQAVVQPLNQLFFPKVIIKMQGIFRPDKKSFFIISMVTIPQLIILTGLVIIILVSSIFINQYTEFFSQYSAKTEVMVNFCIMLVAIFFGVANFMFGSIGLNYLSLRKYYAFYMLLTGIITVCGGFILVFCFHGVGASLNFVFGEALLFSFIIRKYFPAQKKLNL